MSVHEAQPIQDWILSMPDDSKSALQKLISEHEVEVLKGKIKLLGEKCQQMLMAWVLTIPCTALVSALSYEIIILFL